jgi:hypothetical protein
MEICQLKVLGHTGNGEHIVVGFEMSMAFFFNVPIITLLSEAFHLMMDDPPCVDIRVVISNTPYFK